MEFMFIFLCAVVVGLAFIAYIVVDSDLEVFQKIGVVLVVCMILGVFYSIGDGLGKTQASIDRVMWIGEEYVNIDTQSYYYVGSNSVILVDKLNDKSNEILYERVGDYTLRYLLDGVEYTINYDKKTNSITVENMTTGEEKVYKNND